MSKICIECRHYHCNQFAPGGAKCWHEKSPRDIVYGTRVLCSEMRKSGNENCGVMGKFFEPKIIMPPKKSFFTKVKEMLS